MIRFALVVLFAVAPAAAVFSVMVTTEPIVVSAPPHGEQTE